MTLIVALPSSHLGFRTSKFQNPNSQVGESDSEAATDIEDYEEHVEEDIQNDTSLSSTLVSKKTLDEGLANFLNSTMCLRWNFIRFFQGSDNLQFTNCQNCSFCWTYPFVGTSPQTYLQFSKVDLISRFSILLPSERAENSMTRTERKTVTALERKAVEGTLKEFRQRIFNENYSKEFLFESPNIVYSLAIINKAVNNWGIISSKEDLNEYLCLSKQDSDIYLSILWNTIIIATKNAAEQAKLERRIKAQRTREANRQATQLHQNNQNQNPGK